jgi:hypothetical protein
MFEGYAGSAQVFIFADNEWRPISGTTPVPVLDWMTNKTTFTIELKINTKDIQVTENMPVKVLFLEENASGEPSVDTYILPLNITMNL